MSTRAWLRTAAAVLPLATLVGCFDEPPRPDPGVPVFGDAFSAGYEPNAFQYSLLTSLSIDDSKSHSGAKSIRLEVPAAPGFSGGAVLAKDAQDLSQTNALVFWATASRNVTFDKIGFGLNYPPYASTYEVTAVDLPLTTEWVRHVIPIPDPSRLTAERGMLWWADANPTSYDAWLDEVRFDRVDPAALDLVPESGTATRTIAVGGTAQVGGLRVGYVDLDGTRRSIAAPGYFTFASSNPAVATVDAATGRITGVAVGEARVTAKVGSVAAAGGVPVVVVATLPTAPVTAPARPTLPAASVISLLSDAYVNHPVDTWRTSWSSAVLADATVGADHVKRYTALDFAGVEFAAANAVDATAKAFLHLDVWTPNATAVRVKLVDYGADAVGGGGDDSEHEVVIDGESSPDLATGAWVSLDLPLARFAGLASRSHLGLLVLSASPAGSATLSVDNVYFHD